MGKYEEDEAEERKVDRLVACAAGYDDHHFWHVRGGMKLGWFYPDIPDTRPMFMGVRLSLCV